MNQAKVVRCKATKTAKRCTSSSLDDAFGNLYAKYRSEQSYFGYNPSVLKSGIQKYARRAEVNKGLWLPDGSYLDTLALDEGLRVG